MSNPIADGNTSMPHIDGNQKEKELNNEVTVQTEHGKPDMPDVDQNQKEKEINNEVTVQTEHGKPDMPDVDRNQTEKEINNEVTVMKNSISHNTSDNKQGGTDGHNKNDDTGVTATNTPLDQDPNLSQPQPSPDQTKQTAVSAKSGQSKVNSLTGKKKDDAGQQKGKGGNAGTSKSDNNEYYAKLEERLQQLSQRCTSMEETIQNYQNRKNVAYIWIFSSVCIVVIAYAVPSFFFNKEGTASPVSDSRLKAIEEQLRLIKGSLPVDNSQHFQTLQADLVRIEGEFSSKHNVEKQELRNSIEMTTTRFENIKKEVDGFDREVKEIDKKVTDIEISFQDKIDDVKRHIKTFENLPERVQNLKNQIGHVEDDVRSTRTYAEDILAATNEKIEKREKQIIQLNETLESLDHELNITTGKLNRTKEIQDIIHKNTFDKGGKQELRDSIEMTTTRFENIKKEVDGFDRAVKEIDKKIDKIVTDIEISFQDKKEIDKKIDKIGTDIEISFQDKIDDVKRHIKTFENLPERFQNLKNHIGHVEGDVRSTRTYAEDILAATNEKLEKREKQIIQLKKSITDNVESIKHTLELTANEFSRKFGIVNNLEIKLATTEKNIEAFEMKFAAPEQLDKMTSFIEDAKQQVEQLNVAMDKSKEVLRQTLEPTANEFDRIFGTVNNLEIKLATTEKNVKAFEMKFATQEQLDKMTSFIEDAKQQVEQLNVAMDKSKEVFQKYGDTQKLIHQNTFDKDAMIFVLLIIIGGLAGLSFYVCVYKPWQPKESRHSNLDPVQSGKGNTMSMNVNEG